MENVSSIERIADAMELIVMLMPEHMAPEIRTYQFTLSRCQKALVRYFQSVV